ncbi:carotenoid oxygenase family protein [soil metagenome]
MLCENHCPRTRNGALMIPRRDFLALAALTGILGPHRPNLLMANEGTNWPDRPFLQGPFAPVLEEVTAEALPIVGKLPEGLEGMFVRNGPNPQFPPKGDYHWFDGDGMLHGVRLLDGKASYRNRWIRTLGFEAEQAAGKALWGSLGEPPDLALLAKGLPPYKNTANTALVWHLGKLLALWEGGEPHAIALPELDTIGPYNFQGRLKHPFTAHPKIDPLTGEMLCFGYQPIAPYLQYSVLNTKGEIVRTTPIELPRPVMMHDFAMTDRYTIFLDLPATFDFARMALGGPLLKFEPDLPSRFGILPRHAEGKEIHWFEGPSCYVFHTLNAWEDGDEIQLLACRSKRFPEALAMGAPADPAEKDDGLARLHRWRFNLKTGASREEPLDDVPSEFPRINESRLGRPTRFGYLMLGEMDGLLKYDLYTGETQRHLHGQGRLGGEGVFVPRAGGTIEDDGWVLTYVHDLANNQSELVIIDAARFTDPPEARILVPQRIPQGFHGAWVPQEVLGA